MTKMLLAGALAAAMTAAAPAAFAATKSCPTVSPADVESQFTAFNAAWATKDPDKVTSLFAPSAVLLATVSNTPRTTPAAVRDYFVSFLKNSPQATINSSTVKIDCTTATRVGLWTVALTNPTSGVKTDVKARYSFTYLWDGSAWKVDHLHSSVLPET